MQFTLQNNDKSGGNYPDREPFPDKSVFEAKVVEVSQQDSRWDVDENDPSKGKKQELSFKFAVIDPEGKFDNRWVWGRCAAYLSTDSRNKLRQWVQGILDIDVLPEGFAFDTEDLVGKQCRLVISAYEKKNGGGIGNYVEEVRQSRVTSGSLASAPKTAEEFRAQNAPSYDDVEPF